MRSTFAATVHWTDTANVLVTVRFLDHAPIAEQLLLPPQRLLVPVHGIISVHRWALQRLLHRRGRTNCY